MNRDYFEKFILQNIKKNTIPKNKKILITGSNGFIGRYLVYVLANIFKSHNNLIYGIDINKNLNFSYDFAIDNNQKTPKFFRIYNEIPTVILIVVIFVAIFKPL